MLTTIAFALFFAFVILLFIISKNPFIGISKKSDRVVEANYDRLHRHIWNSYYDDIPSPKKMKKHLNELEANFESAKPYMSSELISLYDEDIREMKKDLRNELVSKWEDSADDILANFLDIYLDLTDKESRLDSLEAKSAKKELMNLWRRYYNSAKKYEIPIDADSHLKSYMGSDFSSCMLSEKMLEAKLTDYVNAVCLKEDISFFLDEFKKTYQFIILKPKDFSNIDETFNSKTKCLNLRKKYFELNQRYNTEIDLNNIFIKYMENEFIPCMLSSNEFESYLSDLLSPLRPLLKRKKRLTQELLAALDLSTPIRRSALLKHDYKNGSEKEVTYCYRDLLKKSLIVEEQRGRYYYVSLTEKGKKQLKKSDSVKSVKTIV